ncbi:MAG: protein of unknown function DUF21, partial [uncultured bacterium (gcode 4)]
MDPTSLFLFILLIVWSAFFSGTEMALMIMSQHKIDSLLKEWKSWASALKKIKSKNDKLLITILIWNNLANVWASSLAAVYSIQLAEKLNISGSYGIGIATWAVTLILLLFWEITPKSICSKYSEKISLAVAPIYVFFMYILSPITYFVEFFVRGTNFIFWGKNTSDKMTLEELEAFIDMSHKEWVVEKEEHKKIKSILDLSDTEAFSVMTPRVSVDFAKIDMTVDELCQQLMDSSHTRLPVCGEDTDDVDYVVTFREAFTWQKAWMGTKKLSELDLEKIIKIPLTKRIDRVFEIFQKSHKHIALVLDEHGGVAGIITLEDIIEEVFGDIKDENDREDIYIRRCSDGSLMIKGNVVVDDLLDEFNLEHQDIHLDEEYLGETVGYLIISMLERFPVNDEVL